MKQIFLLLVLFTFSASAQQIGMSQRQYEARQRAERRAEIEEKAKTLKEAAGTNIIRLVDGKAYNVIHSTNWITLPGEYQIGKFARPANEGAIFELHKRMSVSYGSSLSSGGRVWHEFDREVLIRNYTGKIAGDAMPKMRVLPIGTTPEGIAIYDYGTPPQVRIANTNAPSK